MSIKRTTVYLSQDVYDWLAATAKRERRSISSMTETLVNWHRLNTKQLQYEEPSISVEEQRRRDRKQAVLNTAADNLHRAAGLVQDGATEFDDLIAEMMLNDLLIQLRTEAVEEEKE